MVYSECPGDLVTVDFYGPLPRSIGGVEYIFVVLDTFSKYVKLYSIKKATTVTSLRKLIDFYIPEMGKPKRVLSDNGSQFSSPTWGNRLQELGIRTVYSAVGHPKSNPTERVMRELERLFRTLSSDSHARWAKHIAGVECLLNVTTHCSTGFSSFELHFSLKPTDQIKKIIEFSVIDEISHDAKIILAKENINTKFKYRQRAQGNASTVPLNVNDLVLIRIPYKSSAIDKVTKNFFTYIMVPIKSLNHMRIILINRYIL